MGLVTEEAWSPRVSFFISSSIFLHLPMSSILRISLDSAEAGPWHFMIFPGHTMCFQLTPLLSPPASWQATSHLIFMIQFPAADLVLFLPESLHTLHLYWESSHLANTYLPLRTLPLRSGICGLAASDSPGCFLKMQNLGPHLSPVESESIL